MSQNRLWRRTSWVAMAVLCVAVGSKRLAGQTLGPCPDSIPRVRTACGTYEVYEDRAARSGRKIQLNVMVLRARNATPTKDAVVRLAGGPGQGATSLARGAAFFYRALLEDRDILLVDQRGTGRSNGLNCHYEGKDRASHLPRGQGRQGPSPRRPALVPLQAPGPRRAVATSGGPSGLIRLSPYAEERRLVPFSVSGLVPDAEGIFERPLLSPDGRTPPAKPRQTREVRDAHPRSPRSAWQPWRRAQEVA